MLGIRGSRAANRKFGKDRPMSDPLKIAVGGINAATARVATSAQKIASASVPNANTDIAAESVSIMLAKNDHAANAAIVKAVKKMNDTLIDVIA